MDRVRDFVNMYCRWVEDRLTEDEKWEELAFFELGIDLGVRQGELLSIKWNQIDYPYIKNIRILKPNSADDYYPPKEISYSTMKILNMLQNNNEFVFTKDIVKMIESIRKSIGDNQFSGHMMRKFKIALKRVNLEEDDLT
ncbi:hypothetical protein LXJ15735_27820 [Lacrimispora xylanolytica]